jgi:serine/threonine protein kinase
MFARKFVKLDTWRGITMEAIKKEIEANNKLSTSAHPHVLRMFRFGPALTVNGYYMDFEYCEINLHEYIQEIDLQKGPKLIAKLFPCSGDGRTDFEKTSNIRNVWSIMYEITNGVLFLHQNNLVHRDLKPGNSIHPFDDFNLFLVLFCCSDGEWKIADFGFTSEGSSNHLIPSSWGRGTQGYMPPELCDFSGKLEYNTKSDIWALGCIFFELLQKKMAFRDNDDVIKYTTGELKIVPELAMASTVIDTTLTVNPADRPSAEQLCEHFGNEPQVGSLRNGQSNVHGRLEIDMDPGRINPDCGEQVNMDKLISGRHGS